MEMKNESFASEMIYDDGCVSEDDSDFEDEEALSLSDLPTFNDSENPSRVESPKTGVESQEEFDFCLWSKDHQSLHETELCAADDVFFQGQILPMDSFAIKHIRDKNVRISVEESMDHNSSSGVFTTSESSSRSSSLNSTSTTSPKSTIDENNNDLLKTRIFNQFQFSHPSPKPNIRNPKNGYFISNPNSKTGSWPLFQVGLVTTPEIGIQDLKVRNNGKRSNNTNNSKDPKKDKEEKKKEPFLFNKNGPLFSNCKCSAVNSESIVIKEDHHQNANANANANANVEGNGKQKQRRTGKHALTRRNRTFEWLKQLSLETASD